MTFVCSVPLGTFFDHYKLLLTAMYYFRRLYPTYGCYMLLSLAICYFRRLCTTLDGYILFLVLPDSGFVRIQDSLAISRTDELKTRLEFKINLSAFYCLCSSMVSSIIFNVRFWKRFFIRNNQMLKMWNFLHLALKIVRKAKN